MTISDLQILMEVNMWTAEPGGTHRSDLVFAEVLHGAQASFAIPASEEGLAQSVLGTPAHEAGVDLGYKWPVPDGNRLYELAGLGRPAGPVDRHLEQLQQLASDGVDFFKMRPPGELPPWALLSEHARVQHETWRVGKRTWVLSLSAFRPSDQKTVQLISEAAFSLNYGDPDDAMVRFISWEHTAIKSLTASHERPPHDGEGHLHGHLRPPATADGTWEFHLHLTTMEGGIPWACCEAEELTEALKHVPWV